MSKEKIDTTLSKETLPSISLKGKVGHKLRGLLEKKMKSTVYKDNFSYLIQVTETNAPTRLYDKETKTSKEVDIEEGDKVWLFGSTVLNVGMKSIEEGEGVEIEFTGEGEKKPGQKPLLKYDVFKVPVNEL